MPEKELIVELQDKKWEGELGIMGFLALVLSLMIITGMLFGVVVPQLVELTGEVRELQGQVKDLQK